jgi:FMN phosphatase YigB (HAD superfamily)
MNRLRNIRAVTFDVGGTLVDPWPSVGHVYAEVATRHGVKDISPDMLNRRFVAAWRARKESAQTEAAWAEIADRVFLGLTARSPSQTFFPELYRYFSDTGSLAHLRRRAAGVGGAGGARPQAWHHLELG